MKYLIKLIKKTELLSALSIRLVYWTGKSKVPIHPKHLIREGEAIWFRTLLNKKTVVLDVGCGSGQHSIRIAPFVKKIVALDYDSKNLKIAQEGAILKEIKNIFFNKVDLEKKIDIQDKSMDLIIAFDILEHINKRQFFLKELKRILKSKGRLLVVIPNLETSWKKIQKKHGLFYYSDPDHKIEYTKETIEKELTKAGFKIMSINPVSYDTPWVGFIDLVGGLSLSLYRRLSDWKKMMLKEHPENCSGYQIEATV